MYEYEYRQIERLEAENELLYKLLNDIRDDLSTRADVAGTDTVPMSASLWERLTEITKGSF